MRKKYFTVFILILVCLIGVISGCGSSSSAKTLSEQAKEVDLMNGANTKAIGKVSIVEIDSSKVTNDALLEWTHFAEANVGSKGKKYNYAIILFKDKPLHGVMYNGILQTEVIFEKQKNGSYMMANQGKIMVEKEGKLVPLD